MPTFIESRLARPVATHSTGKRSKSAVRSRRVAKSRSKSLTKSTGINEDMQGQRKGLSGWHVAQEYKAQKSKEIIRDYSRAAAMGRM